MSKRRKIRGDFIAKNHLDGQHLANVKLSPRPKFATISGGYDSDAQFEMTDATIPPLTQIKRGQTQFQSNPIPLIIYLNFEFPLGVTNFQRDSEHVLL